MQTAGALVGLVTLEAISPCVLKLLVAVFFLISVFGCLYSHELFVLYILTSLALYIFAVSCWTWCSLNSKNRKEVWKQKAHQDLSRKLTPVSTGCPPCHMITLEDIDIQNNGILSLRKGLLDLFLRHSNCAAPQLSVLSTAWFEVVFKNSWKFLPILQQAQSNQEQLFPERDVSAVHSTTWTATNTAFLPNARRAAYFVAHCTSSSNWTRITHCKQLTEPYMHLQLLLEPLSRAHTCTVYTRI